MVFNKILQIILILSLVRIGIDLLPWSKTKCQACKHMRRSHSFRNGYCMEGDCLCDNMLTVAQDRMVYWEEEFA